MENSSNSFTIYFCPFDTLYKYRIIELILTIAIIVANTTWPLVKCVWTDLVYYSPHFTDKETKPNRQHEMTKIPQLVNVRTMILIPESIGLPLSCIYTVL